MTKAFGTEDCDANVLLDGIGRAELVEVWGSDERIVEAARQSTGKGFHGWGTHENPGGDEKLLRYLYANRHDTPFEMAGAIIEVQAPIMVFREWHRHRTMSYNEMSARYVQMPDLHYVPPRARIKGQSKTNKQATDMGATLPDETVDWFIAGVERQQREIYEFYEEALKRGISREIARINTPVSRYSRMWAQANLRNWLAFLTLRNAPGAQEEIRRYAQAILIMLAGHFPRTIELFLEGNARATSRL